MSLVIKVENISKKYLIGHNVSSSLRETIEHKWNLLTRKQSNTIEEFWALKEITFEVKQGEVLGIIGKNGAGKSTLLKILSRITEPTTGRIEINGRVSSLLEVGTGFHPELTGRENIFLNGTILGMTRKEVKEKFEEIVDFSGVEKFIDTPVKHYSSGMYVRLAFAVAAHLEPEILIIDEVLSVGDAEFQKKCLGKMKDVAGQGRTVLFVSHNMSAVQSLCGSGIVINNGILSFCDNKISLVIKYYLDSISYKSKKPFWKNEFIKTEDNDYIVPVEMYITTGSHSEIIDNITINSNKDIYLHIILEVKKTHSRMTIGYSIFNENDTLLYWSYPSDNITNNSELKTGTSHLYTQLPIGILNEGDYRIELCGGLDRVQWFYNPGFSNPNICISILKDKSKSLFWTEKRPGILAVVSPWYQK